MAASSGKGGGGLTLRILFVVLSIPLLLELELRLVALFVQPEARTFEAEARSHGVRILSVGDSNTYGLWLDDLSDAYPNALESLWNSRDDLASVEVINLGYQGMSCSQLRNRFGQMLRASNPDLVTAMIGHNDYWTVPESLEEAKKLETRLWRHSRFFRLLYMIQRSLSNDQVEIDDDAGQLTMRYRGEEFDLKSDGVFAGSIDNWRVDLARCLGDLANQADEYGTPILFLTYPSGARHYAKGNRIIRQSVGKLGRPILDLEPIFQPLCPEVECSLFYPDQHPTAPGHRIIAEVLLGAILDGLQEPLDPGPSEPVLGPAKSTPQFPNTSDPGGEIEHDE